jgi:hypothetical protein
VCRVGIIFLAVLLSGCAIEEWRNADLQLDVSGTDWDTEERVRLCVDGVGILEEALASGRVGFTGLPEGIEITLTVDILEESDDEGVGVRRGRAGPVSFADGDWQSVEWAECEDDCTACTASGERAESGGRLLAVRFQ